MMDITLRNLASIIVFDGDKYLLLYRQSRLFNSPKWIPTAGGHMEQDEINQPSKCLWREVYEETGLLPEHFCDVALRYVTSTLRGSELRHNYYYFSRFTAELPVDPVSNEGNLAWKTVREIPMLAMPSSFMACITHFIRYGCNTDCLYAANGFVRDGKLQYAINEISVAESEIK